MMVPLQMWDGFVKSADLHYTIDRLTVMGERCLNGQGNGVNMRGKTIRRIGAYILLAQMLFSTVIPCHAAQIGAGASVDSTAEPPFITSVSISPGTVVVPKGETYAFIVSVSGEGAFSGAVAWSVSGQTSRNTFIDSNGVLNVASDETASSLIVKVVSKEDSRYSASALVTLPVSDYLIRVKASPENGGVVYGSGTVREGGSAAISAVANNGFTFEGWTLNGNRVSQDAQYTASNIRGDVTYVAEFKPVNCRITVNVNDSNAGTATESRNVNYGEGMALEAWAKEGYQFDCWTENGNAVSRDSRMQLDNIRESRTFTAVFVKKNEQPKTYTITASASSENGTITPAGKSTVKEGEGILYTMTPKSGYFVSKVYVDGKAVGWMNSFNFTDVRENHTISVDFAESPTRDKNSAATEKPARTDNKTDYQNGTANGDNKTDKEQEEDENRPNRDKDTDKNDDDEAREDSGEKPQESEPTGTLKYLDIPVEEAEQLVEGNNDAKLMTGALETGDLQMTIHNDFADARQETARNGSYKDTSVPNFEIVWDFLLAGDEKMEMLQGNAPTAIDLYIDDANGKEAPQVQKGFAENKLPGMNIGQYFQVSLTASKKGETQTVSTLPAALQIVIHVPEHLKAEKRQFYILRLHTKEDGSQEFAQLADEDDDPDTITFSADKFSSYAVAYIDWQSENEAGSEGREKGFGERRLRNAAGIVVVFLALAVTVTGVIYIAGKKRR